MVGLLADRPQRGRQLGPLDHIAADFEALFAKHCQDVGHAKPTGEKALQSFLISESYKHGRHMQPINVASQNTDEPVDLVFVMDEIAIPVFEGKRVCDVLALRREGKHAIPVLLELKDKRLLKLLVEQAESYASLIDLHADLFAELFGVLLGEHVRFDAPAEKWIVWPASLNEADPHEDWLAERGVRVVGYTKSDAAHVAQGGAYVMRVGKSIRAPLAKVSGT